MAAQSLDNNNFSAVRPPPINREVEQWNAATEPAERLRLWSDFLTPRKIILMTAAICGRFVAVNKSSFTSGIWKDLYAFVHDVDPIIGLRSVRGVTYPREIDERYRILLRDIEKAVMRTGDDVSPQERQALRQMHEVLHLLRLPSLIIWSMPDTNCLIPLFRQEDELWFRVPKNDVMEIIQCLAGNPFARKEFPDTWRTPTVHSIADGIYKDRGFDRLPVLADALEDAGCDDAETLAHLRVPIHHFRGCSVVGSYS